MKSKRVCIATNFTSADAAYSLNRVTQDQIKMLVENDYAPVVLVNEGFKAVEWYEKAELRYLPNVAAHNEVTKDTTFDDDVEKVYLSLKEHLKDIDIVITHDWIYQPGALKQNLAARRVIKDYPNIRWLHWIHSATPPYTIANLRPIFQEEYLKLMEQPFPNSFYIAFNRIAMPSVAKNFGVSDDVVKYVPHAIDLGSYYGMDELTKKLFDEKKIWSADAVCVYPIRLDRGKQVEYVIKTMSQLKEFDMQVRLIIADFHSTGGDKLVYRDELKNLAIDWGLVGNDITFTSEFDKSWGYQMPWEILAKIEQYANVYIHPSVSETYSLTTQEAGVGGAVVVLNQDFPPYRDIYGPHAIYRKYSSNWDVLADVRDGYTDKTHTDTKYGPNEAPDHMRKAFEKNYHHETAGMIAYHLQNDPSLALQIFLRKTRNLEAVFKNHLEPLFYG
jgi:glycosyltransferase involved in cell wall biosynthesis